MATPKSRIEANKTYEKNNYDNENKKLKIYYSKILNKLN